MTEPAAALARYDDLRAMVINCTLKRSPDRSHTQGLIERTTNADGQGAEYRQVLQGPGGRRIDGDYRVTVYDPPRRLEFSVTAGPARPTGVFELTANPDNTTDVRFALNLAPAGMMRLMTPMISKQMRTEVAQLDTLKAIMERAES